MEDFSTKAKLFKKRWTLNELNMFLEQQTPFKVIDHYLITDPTGKEWINSMVCLR